MGLFKFDLFRSFAIGFLIGAAALALSMALDMPDDGKVPSLVQPAP